MVFRQVVTFSRVSEALYLKNKAPITHTSWIPFKKQNKKKPSGQLVKKKHGRGNRVEWAHKLTSISVTDMAYF